VKGETMSNEATMKKYRLIKSDREGLYRVKALRDFGNVKKGEIGGYVDGEHNLSHDGNCWVYGDALVYGNAQVSGNAWVYGDAWVYGNAQVSGNAWVFGNALVFGNAQVSGDAWVSKSPINCIMFPYSITITDNHVQVGCELLRLSHLAQDIKKATKEHRVSSGLVKKYQAIIKAFLIEKKP